jgi:hypothetical protein
MAAAYFWKLFKPKKKDRGKHAQAAYDKSLCFHGASRSALLLLAAAGSMGSNRKWPGRSIPRPLCLICSDPRVNPSCPKSQR